MFKKMMMFFLGLFLLMTATFSHAASITVTTPKPNTTLLKNIPYKVTWIKSGPQHNTVKIRLTNVPGTSNVKLITNNTANSGSYTIPKNIFMNVPDGSYRIKVVTLDNKVQGLSGVIKLRPRPMLKPTVKPKVGKKAGILAGSIKTISVEAPKENSRLTKGKKYSIAFKPYLVDGPYTFDLVKGNSKQKVFGIQPLSIKPWLGGEKLVAEWVVPEAKLNLLLGYRVRVSSGKTVGYSKKFYIKDGPWKKGKHEIPVTRVNNKVYSYWKKYNDKFVLAFPAESADPGQGRLRVGYEQYSDKDHFKNYIYRSFVFFDVSSLKDKGLITKASLKYNHYAGCNTFKPIVHILNNKWSGDPGELFSISSSQVNPANLGATILSNWARNPSSNYGFVFIGANESTRSPGKKRCLANFDQVKLVVETQTP